MLLEPLPIMSKPNKYVWWEITLFLVMYRPVGQFHFAGPARPMSKPIDREFESEPILSHKHEPYKIIFCRSGVPMFWKHHHHQQQPRRSLNFCYSI